MACNQKANYSTIIYGCQYCPKKVGTYKTCDVVEIFHDVDILPQFVTMRCQIKEVLAEELIGDEDDTIKKSSVTIVNQILQYGSFKMFGLKKELQHYV